ncbi:MAG: hypothetical protein J5964_00980 [Eubacterium sp.]|nr:hypothetical protein [Eubacterium sp.]
MEQISELRFDFPRKSKCLNREEYEFRNMLTVSQLIVSCALSRKESRGAHYRTDFPQTSENCKHSIITKDEMLEISVTN